MRFLNANEVSGLAKGRVSKSTVLSAVRRGELKDHGVTDPGRKKHVCRITKADAIQWLGARGLRRTRSVTTNGAAADGAIVPAATSRALDTAFSERREQHAELLSTLRALRGAVDTMNVLLTKLL